MAPSERPSCPSRGGPGTRRARRALLRATLATATLAAGPLAGVTASPAAAAAQMRGETPGVYAFVGVNVLPMDEERVIPNQMVVVRDGRVVDMGPAELMDPPGDAVLIEAHDQWLVPGLAEMHAHVPPVPAGSDAWPDRQALEDLMFLYVANGITTIRGMLGSPYQLELREALERGEILGPRFFVGAPSLNGNSAPDPATAVELVRRHAALGYDLQKIHPGLDRPTWDAMAAAAHDAGLTFGGHVPAAVGLRHALATGMSTVDHLDGFLEASTAPEVRERALRGEASLAEIVDGVTPRRIDETVRAAAEAGVWVVPTQYLWANLYGASDAEERLRQPEMRYVSEQQKAAWRRQAAGRPQLDPEVLERFLSLRDLALERAADGGVGILMGTDSPQLFNVPGFALHREIDVMREAGMTPWQILESGTRNVARYAEEDLGEDGRFGTVAPGMRADLVLLEGNPLEDLANLRRRAGVMVNGRWLSAGELEAGLEAIATRHAAGSEG